MSSSTVHSAGPWREGGRLLNAMSITLSRDSGSSAKKSTPPEHLIGHNVPSLSWLGAMPCACRWPHP